ncbi:TetR family transcriptional regulator [Rhodococcus sp. SRB_17]|uniref:TetR/AcrR family transcriptional regulator n=1 Tax=Rhodococcus sp. ARC_M6 TaxID=2928852 RepID=UPI001469D474|nr:TetR/AcrR family transcriptional regulator [Rhodococcus sp. ARC_M6]MCJ0902291.1 TetR/AcrR family transcriptional regulator [Rhodococcus sp. ARC_M6]NMM88462.1 TetR family transcriptional regulator [Rhodococcus sp. SRB_17]
MTNTAAKPTLREKQKQQTRADLVEAADALFTERGYAAVTVEDIVGRVGCSRATFYLHFPGKLDILKALGSNTVMSSTLAIFTDLDRVLESGSRDEFAGWINRALDWCRDHHHLMRAWDEAMVLEPEFRALARAGISALPNAMTSYLARWPEERRDEAKLRVELLLTQIERFFIRWAEQGAITAGADAAADVLTDIWFPALTPPV